MFNHPLLKAKATIRPRTVMFKILKKLVEHAGGSPSHMAVPQRQFLGCGFDRLAQPKNPVESGEESCAVCTTFAVNKCRVLRLGNGLLNV
jgi:hypothetical protein